MASGYTKATGGFLHMAKGSIDPNLAESLRANPNVLRVTARTVVFTPISLTAGSSSTYIP